MIVDAPSVSDELADGFPWQEFAACLPGSLAQILAEAEAESDRPWLGLLAPDDLNSLVLRLLAHDPLSAVVARGRIAAQWPRPSTALAPTA